MHFIYEQADVEVVFSFSDLGVADEFDPSWGPAHSICAQKGANSPGGLGPFGIMTLATVDFHEYTPVFFRIFKAENNKHKVVLCSDARKWVLDPFYEYRPFHLLNILELGLT